MKKYVLVIKKNNNVKIGLNEYTKEEAESKLEQKKMVGINNMEIMSLEEAYGIK